MPIKKNERKRGESFDGVQKAIDNFHGDDKMKKKHWITFWVILALVVIFTFINFGSLSTPETWWQTEDTNEYVVFEIPEGAYVGEMWIFHGIMDEDYPTMKVYTSSELTVDESQWKIAKKEHTFENGLMYRYNLVHDFEGKNVPYVVLKMSKSLMRFNDVCILDSRTNEPIAIKAIETNSSNKDLSYLTDENHLFIGGNTNFIGMYFDEVYHARTAFEFIQGWTIFETTHPVLGKMIMSLGIMVFGMNPFGWRIMNGLFSIATVILLFFFAKKMFKKPMMALIVMGLSAVEGLRYTLGRISTIDTFACFFIILAFYFMYTFYEKGIDMKKICKSLIPFALAGISFGFAISVKWTGFYAGLGLLILLVIVAIKTISSFASARENINDGEYSEGDKVCAKKFPLAVLLTLLFGLVFFIVIPLIIYAAPYKIFMTTREGSFLEIFLSEQKNMLSFHGGLNDVHTSMSPWWSWPLNGRSLYAAQSDEFFGMYSRIHIMQTTAMALFGLWSLIYFIIYLCKYVHRKRKQTLTKEETIFFDHIKIPLIFILVGYMSTWLPWAFIQRSTFIYHFYQTATFQLLLIGLYIYSKLILERDIFYSGELAILNGRKKTITKGAARGILLIALCVFNFLLFLPVFTGLPLSHLGAMLFFRWANGGWGYGL